MAESIGFIGISGVFALMLKVYGVYDVDKRWVLLRPTSYNWASCGGAKSNCKGWAIKTGFAEGMNCQNDIKVHYAQI